jgi:uncharacterized membrane protein YccC
VVHSARTAVAAVASVLAARLCRLPEGYWAPITTLVVTQSSLGAALTVSWQRFVGTILGAAVGAIVAAHFGPNVLIFGACVFILGVLCAMVHSDRSAYRFGGVTLSIVLLIPRPGLAWQIAFHRFAEVSIGLGVALVLAWVWPESKEGTTIREKLRRRRRSSRTRTSLKLTWLEHFRSERWKVRRNITRAMGR